MRSPRAIPCGSNSLTRIASGSRMPITRAGPIIASIGIASMLNAPSMK